jgi:hypothetical protein
MPRITEMLIFSTMKTKKSNKSYWVVATRKAFEVQDAFGVVVLNGRVLSGLSKTDADALTKQLNDNVERRKLQETITLQLSWIKQLSDNPSIDPKYLKDVLTQLKAITK